MFLIQFHAVIPQPSILYAPYLHKCKFRVRMEYYHGNVII